MPASEPQQSVERLHCLAAPYQIAVSGREHRLAGDCAAIERGGPLLVVRSDCLAHIAVEHRDGRIDGESDAQEAKSEILRLKAQVRRVEEERDLLKKAARYFAREPE